jgi:hypothetical protein
MNRWTRSLLVGVAFAGLVICPTVAAEGWDLQVRAQIGEAESVAYRVRIDDANLRASEVDGQREFLLTSEGFTLINHEEKSYWFLSFAQLEQLVKGMAMMNGDKDGATDEASEAVFAIEPTGKKAKIAGLKAKELLLTEDGEPIARAWVADAIAVDAILGTVGRLVDMAPDSLKGGLGHLDLYKHLTGFPVKLEDLVAGQTLEVIEAKRADLPASAWKTPEGYTTGTGISEGN